MNSSNKEFRCNLAFTEKKNESSNWIPLARYYINLRFQIYCTDDFWIESKKCRCTEPLFCSLFVVVHDHTDHDNHWWKYDSNWFDWVDRGYKQTTLILNLVFDLTQRFCTFLRTQPEPLAALLANTSAQCVGWRWASMKCGCKRMKQPMYYLYILFGSCVHRHMRPCKQIDNHLVVWRVRGCMYHACIRIGFV